ncbi:2-isopropylmalate synthase [Dethiosulfatarculus sandiegensis]|uniref:2-isopropylmalate synthase n=1 Tax=Dethiosulfatarculus sandiegensis TaxID=1429043 RepID=A0A0D2HZU8_9BACT|nr:2-isopropylmalate synthase [Dethiosulfatarculus sandiegensis]KIX15813.1 citramalate synthase [Dethiosulfatarculus sandiegensis]
MSRDTVQVKRSVSIFDTTLRDGEQMPGLAFSLTDKLSIAKKLDQLGVAVIEAGFPANSEQEKEAVAKVAQEVSCQVSAMARVVPKDIDPALESGAQMVNLIASTSQIQMARQSGVDYEQTLLAIAKSVKAVKAAKRTAMFTPMDATRTEPDFLRKACLTAEKAGADWIAITDTVGIARPAFIRQLAAMVKKTVTVPLAIHCKNDFGLAVANTLAGIEAGAEMAQVCLNGLGERAGNAALEEVVMALTCLEEIDTKINTRLLYPACRLVERISQAAVPRNKAVVGQNAFTHESGIHATGVIKDSRTFEPALMTPEMVGHSRRLGVGKHTGKKGLARVLSEAGLEPEPQELMEIYNQARAITSKGKQLLNSDLFALAESVMQKNRPPARAVLLEQLVVTTGDQIAPTASVQAKVHGKTRIEAQVGVGPVDAAFCAVKRMLGKDSGMEITEYYVNAVSGGSDATVRVQVTVEDQETTNRISASSAHLDIVMASVDALVTCINHLIRLKGETITRKENS